MPLLIDNYEIDAEISSEHQFDSEVTEHPVEKGGDVTDHVRAKPIVLTIEGVVSDTPIGALAARRNQFTIVDGEAFALPSDEALARLLQIRDNREPVTVETSLRVYENMALESLSTTRDAATGDCLRFRATFRQLELVTNRRTTVLVAVPRSAGKVHRGHKGSPFAPTEAPAPAAKTQENVEALNSVLR